MSNPNDNQNAYHAALQINRTLKKEIDELKEENDALKEKLKEVLETLGVNYEEEDDGIKTVSKRHS